MPITNVTPLKLEKLLKLLDTVLMSNDCVAFSEFYTAIIQRPLSEEFYKNIVERLKNKTLGNSTASLLIRLVDASYLSATSSQKPDYSFLKLPIFEKHPLAWQVRGYLVARKLIKPQLNDFSEEQRQELQDAFARADSPVKHPDLNGFYYRQSLSHYRDNPIALCSVAIAILCNEITIQLSDFPENVRVSIQVSVDQFHANHQRRHQSAIYLGHAESLDKNCGFVWYSVGEGVRYGIIKPDKSHFLEINDPEINTAFDKIDTQLKERLLAGYYYRKALLNDKNNGKVWLQLAMEIQQGFIKPSLTDFPKDQWPELQIVFTKANTTEKEKQLAGYYLRQVILVDPAFSAAWYHLAWYIKPGLIEPRLTDFPMDQQSQYTAIFDQGQLQNNIPRLRVLYYRQAVLLDENNDEARYVLGLGVRHNLIEPQLYDFPIAQRGRLKPYFDNAYALQIQNTLCAYYFRDVALSNPNHINAWLHLGYEVECGHIKPEFSDFTQEQCAALQVAFDNANKLDNFRMMCGNYYRHALERDMTNANIYSLIASCILNKWINPKLSDFPLNQQEELQPIFNAALQKDELWTLHAHYYRRAIQLARQSGYHSAKFVHAWNSLGCAILNEYIKPSLSDFPESEQATLKIEFEEARISNKEKSLSGYYFRTCVLISPNYDHGWYNLGCAIQSGIIKPQLSDFPADQHAALKNDFERAYQSGKEFTRCGHYFRKAVSLSNNNDKFICRLTYAIQCAWIKPQLTDFPENERPALEPLFLQASISNNEFRLSGHYYQKVIGLNPNNANGWSGLGGAFYDGSVTPQLQDFPESEHSEIRKILSLAAPEKRQVFSSICFRKAVILNPNLVHAWKNLWIAIENGWTKPDQREKALLNLPVLYSHNSQLLSGYYNRQIILRDASYGRAWLTLGLAIKNNWGDIKAELSDFPENQRPELGAIFTKANENDKNKRLCAFYFRQALLMGCTTREVWIHLGEAVAAGWIVPKLTDFPLDQRRLHAVAFNNAKTIAQKKALHTLYLNQVLPSLPDHRMNRLNENNSATLSQQEMRGDAGQNNPLPVLTNNNLTALALASRLLPQAERRLNLPPLALPPVSVPQTTQLKSAAPLVSFNSEQRLIPPAVSVTPLVDVLNRTTTTTSSAQKRASSPLIDSTEGFFKKPKPIEGVSSADDDASANNELNQDIPQINSATENIIMSGTGIPLAPTTSLFDDEFTDVSNTTVVIPSQPQFRMPIPTPVQASEEDLTEASDTTQMMSCQKRSNIPSSKLVQVKEEKLNDASNTPSDAPHSRRPRTG